jgi:CheY-like chemotaxis protein
MRAGAGAGEDEAGAGARAEAGARVVALVPDLLFGSQVQGMLRTGGFEVELVGSAERARERLPGAGVLVVDLTSAELDGAALVRELTGAGSLTGVRTLGFYAHVDPDTRQRALDAGFDQVVPRSRMAREGAELVRRLLGAE